MEWLLAGLGVAAAEGVNASFRVNQLLLASVEGMALRADADGHLGNGGFDLELVAAGAGHDALLVLGMNLLLHCCSPYYGTVLRAVPN